MRQSETIDGRQRAPIRRTNSPGQFRADRTPAYAGAQIRTGRRLLRLSREGLAERLGMTAPVLAAYEHGERMVPPAALAQIAVHLGKPLPWFHHRAAQLTSCAEAAATVAAAPTFVLLVDDAPDVLVTLGAFLGRAGIQVIKAASGDEALRIVASDQSLHAIVTDHAMPGLSGTELLLHAAQLRPELPGLVVTGFADSRSLGELPAHVRVLRKPFRREELVRSVQHMTRRAGETLAQAAALQVAATG